MLEGDEWLILPWEEEDKSDVYRKSWTREVQILLKMKCFLK